MSIYINSEESLKNIINLYIKNHSISKGYIGIDNLSKIFYYKRRNIISEAYTKLKYIQKNPYSNSYIDTEVIADKNTGVRITFLVNKDNQYYSSVPLEERFIFGYYPDYRVNITPETGLSNFDKYTIFARNGDSKSSEYAKGPLFEHTNYDVRHTVIFNYKNCKQHYDERTSGTRIPTGEYDFNNEYNTTLLLGASREELEIHPSALGLRIYHCIITQGEEIIRNLCPVRRNRDGKIGLYDIIEKKFYPVLGTEEFIGSDENGDEDTCSTVICEFIEPFVCASFVTCPANVGCRTKLDCNTLCPVEACYECDFCAFHGTGYCQSQACTSFFCTTYGQQYCASEGQYCVEEYCSSNNTTPTQIYAQSIYGNGATGYILNTDGNIYDSIGDDYFVSAGWYNIAGYYEGDPVIRINGQDIVLKWYNSTGSDECPNLTPCYS